MRLNKAVIFRNGYQQYKTSKLRGMMMISRCYLVSNGESINHLLFKIVWLQIMLGFVVECWVSLELIGVHLL